MPEINLIFNKGYKWSSDKNIFVKGYIFDNNNTFLQDDRLVNFFGKIETLTDFHTKLKEANGVFSVIIKTKNETFVAVDKTRFFPLFYTIINGKFHISDDAFYLIKKLKNPQINNPQLAIFKASGYTLNNNTLISDIKQIIPSQFISFSKNEIIDSGSFFSYTTHKTSELNYDLLKKEASNHFENTFKRLITSLNGKQVALPLSGGYDSRLIATMLKKHNYKNVICFTYGRKNNKEIENSRKTAEILGYKWIFVEYNDEITKDYFNTELFKEYVKFAGKITSMPYMQEYFAVKYLKENNIIEDNAIFIPGHAGDLLGGSRFIKNIFKNSEFSELAGIIYNKNISLWKTKKSIKKQIIKEIKNELDYLKPAENILPYSLFEDFEIKERIAKFIFNSSSVFDFFGYQIAFPFWDNELIQFFKEVPAEFKYNKLLYDDVLKNFFIKQNVNFKKELSPNKKQIIFQKIKNKVKKFAPSKLRYRILLRNDWCSYSIITKPMARDINFNYKKIKKFNSIITVWYSDFIKNQLK